MIDLFLISFLALYFEVLFIRWVPSSIQVVAFFTNIILLSSFLGLGIGCFISETRRDLLKIFPFSMLCYVLLVLSFNNTAISLDTGLAKTEHIVGFYATGANFLVIVIVIFIVNALVFVPLGQKLGCCLKLFKPLSAYAINICGSILGVAVFSCLAYLWIKPVYWFVFGLSVVAWYYRGSLKQLLLQGLIFTAILLAVVHINVHSRWSPYYRVDVIPIVPAESSDQAVGFKISVNNMFHQNALDLTAQSVRRFPELENFKHIYEFPYRAIPAKKVLILGAGSGNDAAAALRMGALDIEAVEIDPLIAGLGTSLHPERPYAKKNVRLYIDDARSFIKKTNESFDLITFGYLDAHKVLSQFSSVRLDNFIYTRESFAEIKKHLNPDGVLSLTYLLFKDWLGARLYATLREVFGDDILVFRTSTYGAYDDTVIFLAGPGIKKAGLVNDPKVKRFDGYATHRGFITDDWPYLYVTQRNIPAHYLVIILAIAAISFAGVFLANFPSLPKFDMHFFFLGAGFMLLETVSITRCALLFGSTWVVNSVVIVSILSMALIATFYAEKIKRIRIKVLYLLLAVSLLWNWLVGPGSYLAFSKALGTILSSVACALPVLFSSIIFAGSFKRSKNVPVVFACNLLGAMGGGCLEYLSMLTGFRALYLLVILIYCLSYIGLVLKREVSFFP